MSEPDALAAALLELSQQAGKLTELDRREAAHATQAAEGLAGLTQLSTSLKHSIDDQAEILAGLDGLDEKVTGLALRLNDIAPADDDPNFRNYRPLPSPQFWKLDGQARDEAIGRLRAWVEHVYQPGYGHVAAALGACWDQHPICLYALDWLSELWSALYLQPRRTAGTLAGQAEWQTRLLPAAAGQMAAETTRCQHAVRRPGLSIRIGADQ